MKQRIVAIIQARMGSTRLPGKMLMPLVAGKGALELMLERVSRAKTLDRIIVATTTSALDNPLADLCAQLHIPCFKGNEEDVLDRYYQAAVAFGPADAVVRLTGDCPLHDPQIIDKAVDFYLRAGADYASNVNPPTFPDGFDVEVFSFLTLERTWKEAAMDYQREHVTSYITENPKLFICANMTHTCDLSSWRLTIDRPEDMLVIKNVFEALGKPDEIFSFDQVVAYLDEHRELLAINAHIGRNEGYHTRTA